MTVRTNAFLLGAVQNISWRTDTSVGAVSVDTVAPGTDVRHEFALVQIGACVIPANTLRAQLQEFV